MRGFWFAVVLGALMAPAIHAETLIPLKRLTISENTDLPGGDIASLFDTTLDACESACLTNRQCTAFTFNTRNNSCFIKKDPGEAATFDGAYSGYVLKASESAESLAQQRRADLAFLGDWDISPATGLAGNIANLHTTNGYSAEEQTAAARDAEANGNYDSAYRFAGAATVADDTADNWLEYARLQLEAANYDNNNASSLRDAAFRATINAYLRADNAALQHNILVMMGTALEALQRGPDTVKALRLAQLIQPRDDTAALLADASGKYGFRVVDNSVQSDSNRPRLCINFSEDLPKSGVDFASFVQLPEPGMSVSFDGYRQLCVEGIEPGGRYNITLRAGLPSLDGQTLTKAVPITAYIKDRSPGVRFTGRGYVLPRTGNASMPVVTVNTTTLDLAVFKVTDRNLLRIMQNGYFDTPMYEYEAEDFETQMGTKIWEGSATVSQTVNKDITTRLPLDEAIAGQPAGIYALRAAVPGVDPYNIAPAWQWFVVSDLGLTTLSGVDGLHVFVRALGDATAKADVTLQLLSVANEILATATTDAQGYARFDAGLIAGTGSAAPALIVARAGDDTAFLSLTDPEFDLSDRGVEGSQPAPPVDVFLTTDRGAYRAGETVHATALARDSESAAIEKLPLTAILLRPDGVEYVRALSDDLGAGGHVFDFPISASAPRGTWKMEVYGDLEAAALTSKTFLVEDFLPERIDFTLALADTPIRLGDTPLLSIDAKYLFGAPGADLAIEGEVLLRAAQSLDAWPGYVFGKYDDPFNTRVQSFSDFRTDEAGKATVEAALPETDDPKRPIEALFVTRVAEGSGRPVERRITRLLTPSAPMIGIKPMFDEVVPEGAEASFTLIGIGPDTKATPMKIRWDLTRIETNYQWYQQDGNWNWQEVTTRNRVNSGEADLSGPTPISAPVEWGQYELTVTRTDSGDATTSTTFYAGWYAPADVSQTPDTLELSLDKPAYKAGDQAMLRIVPRAAGTALVTVMSNRLIAMKAVEVKEGENLIPLDVTDDWGTGVYVAASVLRPMDVAAGRNPARALGLSYASIDPGTRALKATIETAPEAAPRGPLNVAVQVDGILEGDMAYVTVAAVDQGILNLTAFTPPDPMGHYFGQRKLGIGIRDIYGRLIDGLNGAEGTVRSGGDAGAQARLKAPPPTEELVSYFAGPVEVGADGYARVSFDLPSFNGSVKVMAVAWTKRGVGQASADVLVRDPVVVTASLPRFMQPGDKSRLLLQIVHATGPSGDMQLAVSSSGVTLGKVPTSITLKDKEKTTLEIPFTADPVGIQTITVALTTPDGKVLTKDLKLPVQVNDPVVAKVSRLDLATSQSFTFDEAVFDGLQPGSGRATLAIGPIARLNAPGVLAALDAYPYGCTEQITSKALPLLYFDQVAMAMDLPGATNIKGRIEQAITEVLQNQSSSGAFGLWQPGEGDMWLDAYVTDFLSRARAQGFSVPDQAFRSALDNLRNQVNYYADFDKGGEPLAYALMVLAREGAAAIGDLRYYADVKGDAFATPMAMAQLGAALASYGDQPRADAMFKRASTALNVVLPSEQYWRADYGTAYRDTAAVLTLAVEAGSSAVDREALANQLSASTGTLSTQEATWALLAANALIGTEAGKNITLNGEPATGPLVKVLDATYRDPVIAMNNGATTTLTVTTFGVPVVPEPAGGNGYAISRSYYTLDGQPASLEGLRSGDRLVAVLEVTPFGKGEARLMVTDPLPAGLEIDNPNLITGGSVSALDFLDLATETAHSEFLQDRFLTAIDRMDNQPFRLAYILRAVSPGTFHQPAASVTDMYRPDYTAHTDAGTVTIAP